MALLLLLTAHTTTVLAVCDQSLINHAVDFILAQVTVELEDVIALTNVTANFLMNSSKMELNSGRILGLTTLRRVGDVLLNVTEETMNFVIQLTFDNFTVAYVEYKVDALVIYSV